MQELNNKKTITAWSFYDWANSAYSLIITSAMFPMYYTQIVPDEVVIAGHAFQRSALASFSIALSYIIIAILSPVLSSMADYKGNKKSFMRFFCYLGSLACMAMFFFMEATPGQKDSNVIFGLICSIIASIGYCGSIVFYNAFLPEIASKDQQDRVSAKGFSLGYIGSVLLMLVCFAFILLNQQQHWMSESLPVRISFLLVGLWWIGFAQIPFRVLTETRKHEGIQHENILSKGYKELHQVWQQLKLLPELQKFLASFFFYNMGVLTVMYMATYFASDELNMESTQLLAVVLIIQLVAILGAWLFAKLSDWKGNQLALGLLILIWIGICIAAYFIKEVNAFYMLAFCVGMVMGGIQSLSRSTYAKLLPATDDTASYFSFYDVCEKVGIVIGTTSFGLIAEQLGGMRNSTLALCIYFVIGFILLLRIKTNFTQLSTQ
ncbi:MAG TPA: MFS transporter [Chitinophagaceae bacterium]|nr:MFS transporter [Chitinophagaceae bacterium]